MPQQRMVPAPLAAPQPPYGAPSTFGGPPPAAAGPAKVALLVPLSGANARLGQALLDAAQLALFEAPNDRLTLIPRDTGGTAEGAAKATRGAIADGAQLILGPLLAAEVQAAKPVAANAHINVIAFSTVAQAAGGNVFLMGFLPRQEVLRVVGYARERGLDRFAALAPDSPYGHLMTDALREVATASGARVAAVEYYAPRSGDAQAAIRRLLPAGAPPGSPDASAAAAARPFGALLLPEGGSELRQIARQVREASVETGPPPQLLGSGLWDVPDLGNEPALVGGWFAASPPEARRDFEQRFRAAYGRDPPRLASLGYDAAALAEVLATGRGGQPFSQQAILDPQGFTGVDGLFRFAANGLVQRGLAVLEVEPQGNVVVAPAPQSFQNLGY
jgi:ABC-type branched-subunit amino acid transport system substrate-binding protein